MNEIENNGVERLDFIREKVASDIAMNKFNREILTRFPPEPNGYLHIGHAKAININFSIAEENNGKCNLRMDDTNPAKEDVEYENSIINDIRWLGFDFGEKVFYASDYFEKMYDCAVRLIEKKLAYICELSSQEWENYKGTLNSPGIEPPGRSRSVEENLRLFSEMRAGKHQEGTMVLRAKVDMASPNMHMRDPVIYRIHKAEHFRQGEKWCIYPLYDFAHPLEDAFENITNSLCSLEFEIHRPFYDWVLRSLDFVNPPEQTEFSRLNLGYTVMSKRKLLQLVKENYVSGWDDPRMPTISAMRRRGFPPKAIRNFCQTIGITKFPGITDYSLLEFCVREELNATAPRFLGVIDPLKVIITNYPDEKVEDLDAINNPEDMSAGVRKLAFGKEIYIEKSDFMLEPPKGYFRLSPGKEVRLRYAYFIKCENVLYDSNGNVEAIECSCDWASRGGTSPDGRKVKGTIHWVNCEDAISVKVRLYDRLFNVEQPGANDTDFLTQLNSESLKEVDGFLEKSLIEKKIGDTVQLERLGYFTVDPDTTVDKMVLNRTVPLKDSWGNKNKGK